MSVSSKSTTNLESGDVASVQTPGGGGYGKPIDRDPEIVLEDVVNEKVSIEAAREEYAVIIDPNTFIVDKAATRKYRAELCSEITAEGGER